MTITIPWWAWPIAFAALGVITGEVVDKARGRSQFDFIPFLVFVGLEMLALGLLIGHFV